MSGHARKPKWTATTFAAIEEWREARGLPKRTAAHTLGVTNSTYHNWSRGDAVPTLNSQRRIAEQIGQAPRPTATPTCDGSLEATSTLVSTYLRTQQGAEVSPDELVGLVRGVLAVTRA